MASALTSSTASASLSDVRAMDVLRDPTASALHAKASADPKSAIKAAARQFEALFMQQLMKSMRDTTMSSGMLDNEGTKMGTELLDSQFASQMTGMRGGLSEAIARQLEKQMGGSAAGAPSVSAASPSAAAGASDTGAISQSQADFVSEHQAAARAAQAQSGIPAAFMIAQAAQESGWGQHEIKNADGSSSHNLFGIKAGADWKGAVTQVATTEYVDGQARKVTAKFRAYASYADSFNDYAQLMKSSARYSKVLTDSGTAQGFAQGLQQAGYATDPAYAAKLTRVINTTLRVQRASA